MVGKGAFLGETGKGSVSPPNTQHQHRTPQTTEEGRTAFFCADRKAFTLLLLFIYQHLPAMADHLWRIGNDSAESERLTQAWRLSGFRFYNEADSTQNIVRRLAEADAPAWTLVVADYQTEGRGQYGRRWSAEPGSSVMFSLLMRPLTPGAMGLLPIRIGMAVASALDRYLPIAPNSKAYTWVKWPNDIILNNAKVGGVLCEGSIRGEHSYAIIGVGVNVHRFPQTWLDPVGIPPTYLDQHVRGPISRLEVLGSIIDSIRNCRDLDSEDLSIAELEEFALRDWLRGKMIDSPIQGRVVGITQQGYLVVERPDGNNDLVLSGRISVKPG